MLQVHSAVQVHATVPASNILDDIAHRGLVRRTELLAILRPCYEKDLALRHIEADDSAAAFAAPLVTLSIRSAREKTGHIVSAIRTGSPDYLRRAQIQIAQHSWRQIVAEPRSYHSDDHEEHRRSNGDLIIER
jgi:hypothetical protein